MNPGSLSLVASATRRWSEMSELSRAVTVYSSVILLLTVTLYGTAFLTVIGLLVTSLILTTLILHGLGNVRSSKKVAPASRAVLVTGCDTGFGNALARRLDSLGFKVFAGCLSPDKAGAKSLSNECSNDLYVLPLDITDDEQVEAAVEIVQNNLDGKELWALVNNAGVAAFTEIEWCPMEMYSRIMSVNALGPVRVTKAFLPLLRESQGRVVNVASLAGRFTYPGFSAYSMSKYAVIAFSNALRREMKKWNITVCTVEPTLYKTPISAEAVLLEQNRQMWASTPQHVRAVYGEEYFHEFQRALTKVIDTARGQIDEVTTALLDAVTSVAPQSRYVPSVVIQLRAGVMALLPETWQDPVLMRASPPQRTLSTASYSFGPSRHS